MMEILLGIVIGLLIGEIYWLLRKLLKQDY